MQHNRIKTPNWEEAIARLFSVFCHVIKIKNANYSIHKVQNLGMKEDKYAKPSQRIRSVRYFIREIFRETFYPIL